MEFKCSGCGACCRRLGLLKSKLKELNFPYTVDEKGCCSMLDENNQCKVYNTRPEMCRIEPMFKHFANTDMTKNEYYMKTTQLCNKFIKEDKMDEKYLLNENIYL